MFKQYLKYCSGALWVAAVLVFALGVVQVFQHGSGGLATAGALAFIGVGLFVLVRILNRSTSPPANSNKAGYNPWSSVESPRFREKLSRAVSDSIPTSKTTND